MYYKKYTRPFIPASPSGKRKPFYKSQLQFIKLVFDKYGEGDKFDEALKIVEEEGADINDIKALIIPKKLQRHQILLYAGDFALLQKKVGNVTKLIRDFVNSQVHDAK